jgi:hypothetical protein
MQHFDSNCRKISHMVWYGMVWYGHETVQKGTEYCNEYC